MSRTVFCQYLQLDAEGLDYIPWPGPMGQRLFDHISKDAWAKWIAHQTLLINENRLSPMDPQHRIYLNEQMEKYLFGGGAADAAVGYTPE